MGKNRSRKKRARKEKRLLERAQGDRARQGTRQTREVEKQRRAQQLGPRGHRGQGPKKAQEELRKHQAAEERARRAEAAEKPLTPQREPRLSERGSKVAYRKDNRAKHKNAKAAELEHAVHVLPEQRSSEATRPSSASKLHTRGR